MKQADISSHIESIIPADMWAKYSHVSFGEMADIEELAEYEDELRQAEIEWFEAEDA